MSNDTETDQLPEDQGPAFPKWLKWGLLGALAVVVLGYGAILVYANFINDPEDELGEADLVEALADPTGDEASGAESSEDDPTTTPPASENTTAPTDAPSTSEAPPSSDAPPAASGGEWAVTDASELGYRVQEVLFGVETEGVGRTNQITGGLTIDGTVLTSADFEVDVASIESDDGRRDSQFRGRIMSTDEFPTATFVLTEPVELGTEAVEGATVDTTATGELTLRGVTNEVTFDLSARLENGRIGVLGNIPVVFADYDIANPSFGGVTTEDNGLLEFVLVFEPA